jgi:hypothetical protein
VPPVAAGGDRRDRARGDRRPRRDRGPCAAWQHVPAHGAARPAARLRPRPIVVATIHPSAILRARDDEARRSQRELFTQDLRVAVAALARADHASRSSSAGS